MDKKVWTSGHSLGHQSKVGKGGSIVGKKNFSSFLDELDHLEQFKHVFQKSHYPIELAVPLQQLVLFCLGNPRQMM